tara:strand:+ start:576 stop:884 length:309 start_codon:yes stop_codon:yes gene_type:complete
MIDTGLLRLIQHDLRHTWHQAIIGLGIIALAFATVYVSYLNRQQTGLWDQMLKQQDELNIEWHHLLLEEQTQAEHHRVREIATHQLHMHRPQPKDERVLILP